MAQTATYLRSNVAFHRPIPLTRQHYRARVDVVAMLGGDVETDPVGLPCGNVRVPVSHARLVGLVQSPPRVLRGRIQALGQTLALQVLQEVEFPLNVCTASVVSSQPSRLVITRAYSPVWV